MSNYNFKRIQKSIILNYFIITVIFLILFQNVTNQTCFTGRLTQYPIHVTNNIPQGTCGFGPVFDLMPEEFKSGRIIASNQDYYNGFKTNLDFKTTCDPKTGVSCGNNCGQCVLVTGASGSATYIIGDICDYPVVGEQCAGDMVQFDLNTAGSAQTASPTLKNVADSPGYEMMTYKLVPCTNTGNIGMYFSESGSNQWSVALNFYNYILPIKKVEIKGDGASVSTTNNWIELPRGWTNKYEWRGTQDYLNQKGSIYNGGDGFLLRLTSVLGEILEYKTKITIPTTNIDQQRFDLGFQFSLTDPTNIFDANKKSCDWTGPEKYIYKDKVTNRKANGLKYDQCVFNSTGCRTYFEGSFLAEWWLVTFSLKTAPNLSYSGSECQFSPCIEMLNVNANEVLIFGNSAKFANDLYKNVKFSAKLGSTSKQTSGKLSLSFSGCSTNVDVTTITNQWTEFTVEISKMNCPSTTSIKNLSFLFSATDSLYIDNIYLDTQLKSLTPLPSSSGVVTTNSRLVKVTYLIFLTLLVIFI